MPFAIVCMNELHNPLMGKHGLPEIGLCSLREDAERVLAQVEKTCPHEHFLCETYVLDLS